MQGFWQNLSQLAQGQLFNGGYLSREAVQCLTAPRPRGKTVRVATPPRRRAPWPRLAMPH